MSVWIRSAGNDDTSIRKLSDEEFKSIGEPKEWGVLPVRPMGATIRMTKDRRILIRNTAEVYNPYYMSQSELNKRSLKQRTGIKKRWHLYNTLLGWILFGWYLPDQRL